MGILQAGIVVWISTPSSRGSSQPRDWIQVSHIAGRFFTIWATREAQEYGSGYPIPSLGDLPDPGIKLGSPALQADSLPAELPGNQISKTVANQHSRRNLQQVHPPRGQLNQVFIKNVVFRILVFCLFQQAFTEFLTHTHTHKKKMYQILYILCFVLKPLG